MRRFVAALAVLGVCTFAAGTPGAGAADEPAPSSDAGPSHDTARSALALARQRLDDARVQATDLAAKMSTAQSEQTRLQTSIADAQARIPALRAHADDLRALVRRRAAELYVRNGSSNALESTLAAESAEDGLRAAHLTDTIASHDLDLATQLRASAAQLADEERALESRESDLQKVLAGLQPLNDLLQRRLEVASQAYAKVQALTDGTAKAGADVLTGASFCPVGGVSVFTDDFGEPRPGGPHPGIDMAALPETPVVAVVAGVMRHDVGGDGGNGAWLVGTDQVSYYYADFSRYEGDGRLVQAGDVIGYVGMTGNATGPHLHFEMHPAGGLPVDPFATLLTLCSGDAPPAAAGTASPAAAAPTP